MLEQNQEIEWCFQSRGQLFEKIQNLVDQSGFVTHRCGHHHLITTYYDTDDLKLSKLHGFLLRVRVQDGEYFIQSIKGRKEASSDASIAKRFEYEMNITSDNPDLLAIKDQKISKKIRNIDNNDLTPLFVTDYIRRYVDIELNDVQKTVLQICHDQGSVYLCDKSNAQFIDEIEIELVKGSFESAQSFIAYLNQKLSNPLIPQAIGKGARGFDMYKKCF